MLDRLNKNIGELKSNLEGIKSIVNTKKKSYKSFGQKTINKHLDLQDGNTIEMTIDVNVAFDNEGREKIIQKENIDKMAEEIMSTILKHTKENMLMPKSVLISAKDDLIQKLDDIDIKHKYDDVDLDIIDIQKPKYKITEVILNENLKRDINRIFAISKNKNKIVNDMKIQNSLKSGNATLCNFYGESGSGKSCVIHAIAQELGKNVATLNYNMLESIEVYNIPKLLKSVFEIAKRKNCILVIEESNRLIKEKNTSSNDYNDHVINIVKSCIKNEIGNFDSMLFFTSTIKENIDKYFSRLFFINVEFKKPDYYERENLWKLYTEDKAILSSILDIKTLAQKYKDVSRADIRDILFIAAAIALEENREILYEKDFDLAYKQVLNRY